MSATSCVLDGAAFDGHDPLDAYERLLHDVMHGDHMLFTRADEVERLVGRERRGVGEEARKTMLAIFQLLPEDSELASEYRRKLSLVL